MTRSSAFLWAAACLAMAILLVSCGATPPAGTDLPAPDTAMPATDTPMPATDTPGVPAESPVPTPAGDAAPATRPPVGEVPAGLLEAILADLAERLSVATDEIEVVRGEYVVWNDGSLGCPKPGMMYTQALVPGYQVVLRVGGETFDYRAAENGSFVLCEGGLAPVVSPSAQIVEEVPVPIRPTVPVSPGLESLAAGAIEDLAARLSIPAEQIELVELRPVVWPDGALGCPEPGMVYVQVQQEGVLIRLRAGKQIYPYHGGGGKAPFLCEQAIESTQ